MHGAVAEGRFKGRVRPTLGFSPCVIGGRGLSQRRADRQTRGYLLWQKGELFVTIEHRGLLILASSRLCSVIATGGLLFPDPLLSSFLSCQLLATLILFSSYCSPFAFSLPGSD
jgi:hypothetical protein